MRAEDFALEQVSIIVPVAPDETSHEGLLDDLSILKDSIIISSEGSRAKSLNAGAAIADKPFLWFLHADSCVSQHNITHLGMALKHSPNVLHYFDLAYKESRLASLNACGANFRSRLFGLPYGDQGFCMSRDLFHKIGGYPENAAYGEDLLLVRLAKQSGIKLNRIPSKLETSARKYKQDGWLKLTVLRQWQLIKLMRRKL